MTRSFGDLTAILSHDFDTVIDVRSPAEFAEDHVPGAINLPALSNTQRAEVGTIYKQHDPFTARKLGAAMVARNVADYVDGPLNAHDGSWRPLVYCWRGGQRSGSVATILQQIGWRAEVVNGGYQAYRRLVFRYLYEALLPHRLILLDGYTGTAKTALLHRLSSRGIQTLDLEGLAAHRGSLLGGIPGGQPAQKGFESALAAQLSRLDPDRPTIVEAESSKIGRLMLPKQLWQRMTESPRIEVTASLPARAAFLTDAYADIIADPVALRDRLQPLRTIRGHAVVDAWEALLDTGEFVTLATALMDQHYDPSYDRSRKSDTRDWLGQVHADTLDGSGQETTADALAALIRRL
ncbi:tRNA 2-selenouridine(34) synthase MnmH [Loktanella sp. SALINAS62]|uniref:tRNA 2-selenouridine(34) synthase MnmH n=1 Tax=Loktanella sp. SALINAS62 TaxID=2706124 RepID=UPI001B8B2694|nr:tRNA 2-selenouridine(34) synthase MnmH [Loktanella sp. SALINAS62]MBS1302368.1 tRNA 2-selenouridine(34) synthase MnmH [Loktanella sp. SALINAS62]